MPKVHPATRLVDNLMWTRHGTVYAMWRLRGMRYAGTRQDKRRVVAAHAAMVRSLGGEALLVSVMMPENPVTIVQRMIEGVDLEQCPLWVEEAEHTLDQFVDLPIGERLYWLCVPLANRGGQRLKEPFRAYLHGVRENLDLPEPLLDAEEVEERLLQARKIEELIPAPFAPQRVGGAEHVWLWNHYARRGQVDVPLPTTGSEGDTGELTSGAGGAVFTPRLMDEGARSDPDGPARVDVMNQRLLKISEPLSQDLGLEPSYQVLMAVADTPAGGIRFPGSEWLARLDEFGIDVDWAMNIRVNTREKVLARNRSAVRRLNEQYSQREAESSSGPHELNLAASKLALYDQIFADDRQEVEVEHTVVLAVSATREMVADAGDERGVREETTREVADRATSRAVKLASTVYNQLGIRLERLPGKQSDLWWAMVPGAPRSHIVKAYAHITSSRKWAMMVPLTSRRLGGNEGPVPFLSEETSRPQAVHLNPAGYPELDMSGAVLVVAELGAGKSVFLKTNCAHLVSRGGLFIAIDGSPDGEWVKFAQTAFGTPSTPHADDAQTTPDQEEDADGAVTVVSVLDPRYSMDPIRLLGPEGGAQIAQTFLTMLLTVTDREERSALGEVCSPQYLSEHSIGSVAQMSEHVISGQMDHPGAASLGSAFRTWNTNPLARLVFDKTLPAAPLDSPATVWWTHGLRLPSTQDLASAHLFHELPPDKLMGRAYYRLLTSLGRHLCFADPSVPTALVTDELHRMANPENLGDLEQFAREGRRSKALLWGGTHDVGDVSLAVSKDEEETLASLIPTRLVMRMGSRPMARRAAAWLGIEPGTEEFDATVKTILEELSPKDENGKVPPERRGEGILRDAFGEIGCGRVLPPATPRMAQAALTTPPRRKAA